MSTLTLMNENSVIRKVNAKHQNELVGQMIFSIVIIQLKRRLASPRGVVTRVIIIEID